MRGIRTRLTYSNVMATLAVFIALGGGAYALSRGEVKSKHIARDAVQAKHIKFGVRSTPMLASHVALQEGGQSRPPIGEADGFPEKVAPQSFRATGLRVHLGEPLATGTRTWTLRLTHPNEVNTPLSCTVDAGERTCTSNARVSVPAGTEFLWRVISSGTTETDYALVSWRAVLP